MTHNYFIAPKCFKNTGKNKVGVHLINAIRFKALKPSAAVQRQMEQQKFEGKKNQSAIIRDKDGKILDIYVGYDVIGIYSICPIVERLQRDLSADFLRDVVFEIKGKLKAAEANNICIGWGFSTYAYEFYKKSTVPLPHLLWPSTADKKTVNVTIEAVCLLRNLVNTPTNDLGTNELAGVAKKLATRFEATCTIVKGKKLETEFPMIHAVGRGSRKPPQFIEVKWGKKTDPKLTIVGKGIVYDSGGLNIKPGSSLALMKKDMGGSAHALACAYMIMALKLPVQLTLLISAAENSIDGDCFRPGDIIKTRKGLTVEIKDTDAEGRLVLSDALAYGSEKKPELMIDFATLTGSARSALGPDIPALYSNKDETADSLKKIGMQIEDPVWPMPLWDPYFADYASKVADFCNDGGGYFAGSIKGALFLKQFVDPKIEWVHLDCYAYSHGRPGRAEGGADTGLRTVFAYLQKRYGKNNS